MILAAHIYPVYSGCPGLGVPQDEAIMEAGDEATSISLQREQAGDWEKKPYHQILWHGKVQLLDQSFFVTLAPG